MDDNRRRRNQPPEFEMDLAGPAAWDEQAPERLRSTRAKTGRSRQDGTGGGTGRGSSRSPKTRKKQSYFGRLASWMFWTAFSLGLAGLILAFGVYSYFSQDLPATDGLKNYAPPTVTYFYSDDGRVIAEYSNERRFVVPLTEISPTVINAFLAVEDAMFYRHKGINFKAIVRAALANYTSGDKTQGGSTITQQVVKSFLLTPEKSYSRKIKEMILAVRIEKNLTKDEILHLYLNQIYLGKGAYGVEAAARTYFGKSAKELSIAEAAQLAGITKSPNRNPMTDPEYARDRRLTAIDRMLEVELISEQQAAEAKAEPLQLVGEWPNPTTEVAPYFAEHVRRLMEERFGADSLYKDGWRVFTTVNIEAQRAADGAVAKGLWEYARRRGFKKPVQHLENDGQVTSFLAEATSDLAGQGLKPNRLYKALVVAVDNKNSELSMRVGPWAGHIAKKNLAWAAKGNLSQTFSPGDVIWVRLATDHVVAKEATATSADQNMVVGSLKAPVLELSLEQRLDTQAALLSMEESSGDIKAMVGGRDSSESQFNRATQSQRQPGSSFKPILYASAMDHGYTPGSILNDAPFVVDDVGSGKRWKPVNSDLKFKGPMTLYTALVGSRNLISIKLLDRIGFEALAKTAQDLGITEKLPESLTIALGAHGVRMPELVTAYSAFANMGARAEPRYITRIEDRYGNVVETFESKLVPALDPGSACAVTWMLRGVVEQGTGTVVKPLARPVAGKTGTTNDYSDAWFIGFTPELVTAVWVGTDQQRARAVGEVGGKVAGPIFLYYMREALKNKPVVDFIVPPGAELAPGGAVGICYKAGTVGTGLSESLGTVNPEDDFLRDDFEGIDVSNQPGGGDNPPSWVAAPQPGSSGVPGVQPPRPPVDVAPVATGSGGVVPPPLPPVAPPVAAQPVPPVAVQPAPPVAAQPVPPVAVQPAPPAPVAVQPAPPYQAGMPGVDQQPGAPQIGSAPGTSGGYGSSVSVPPQTGSSSPDGRLVPYGSSGSGGSSSRLGTYGEDEYRAEEARRSESAEAASQAEALRRIAEEARQSSQTPTVPGYDDQAVDNESYFNSGGD